MMMIDELSRDHSMPSPLQMVLERESTADQFLVGAEGDETAFLPYLDGYDIRPNGGVGERLIDVCDVGGRKRVVRCKFLQVRRQETVDVERGRCGCDFRHPVLDLPGDPCS
jgi:hypothetical protein